MSNRFEPDFEGVNAFTPIYDKGEYELLITSIGARAFTQKEEGASDPKKRSYVEVDGVPLSVCADLRFKMIGKVNSRGEVDNELEGEQVESNSLWLHNKGSLKMSKGVLMAIFGFGKDDEEEFNQFYKTGGFGFDIEETDEGGYRPVLGPGWQTLVNKRVRSQMERGVRKTESGDIEEQRFNRFLPAGVGATV